MVLIPVLGFTSGVASGEWMSPVCQSPEPFDWVVPSWNADGGSLEIQVRIEAESAWSPWFSFGRWRLAGLRSSVNNQVFNGFGRVQTDTLLLERPAVRWQVRALLQKAELKRVWLTTAALGKPKQLSFDGEAWGRLLPVSPRSQMAYPGGEHWCSPTSLAMVMAFWGHELSIPEQVVPGVFDQAYQGCGNWAFNTAYAGANGFVAYVDRVDSFAGLERWIAQGVPVIASVVYSQEWLENAPFAHTDGHLLVVCGFTPEGDVAVNDPAASSADGVCLVYRRQQFERAWLDQGGVLYIIYPEGWVCRQ